MIVSSLLQVVIAALVGDNAERLAELPILVCDRPFKVGASGVTHGRAGDQKRVQSVGRQAGKEERIAVAGSGKRRDGMYRYWNWLWP